MSWFPLTSATSGVLSEQARDLLFWGARGSIAPARPHDASIGSAVAGARWQWAEPPKHTIIGICGRPSSVRRERSTISTQSTPPARSATLHVPETVLRSMAEAARQAGRSESEIWAEAAREWLGRRVRDDDPEPPTPAALRRPRPQRSWAGIDALLADLRNLSAPAASVKEAHVPEDNAA